MRCPENQRSLISSLKQLFETGTISPDLQERVFNTVSVISHTVNKLDYISLFDVIGTEQAIVGASAGYSKGANKVVDNWLNEHLNK